MVSLYGCYNFLGYNFFCLENNDKLEIVWDKITGLCTIKLIENENIDVQMNSVLTITLNAVVSNIAVASTAIILYMPIEGHILFSSSLYKASYPLNATELEISSNNIIQITGALPENIDMELKGSPTNSFQLNILIHNTIF